MGSPMRSLPTFLMALSCVACSHVSTAPIQSASAAEAAPVATVTPSAPVSCRSLAAKLATLDLDKGTELFNSSVNRTYKSLYDQCDARDTFNGRPLPLLGGRRLKCSTDPNKVAFIRRFPDGTVVFRAKMGVDTDGSPASQGPHRNLADSPHTSLHFDSGRNDFVNAEEFSFVVTPLQSNIYRTAFPRDSGIQLGDLAVIVKGDSCSFGIVADQGPPYRLGEASVKAHEELGNPQCAVAGQYPCVQFKARGSGIGIPSGVAYMIFPGTRPAPLLARTISSVAAENGKARVVGFLDKFQRR